MTTNNEYSDERIQGISHTRKTKEEGNRNKYQDSARIFVVQKRIWNSIFMKEVILGYL